VRALAIGLLIAQTLSGSVTYDKDGRRPGAMRENPYGGFDLYDKNSNRLGYGKTSPYDPTVIELFDSRSNRIGTIRRSPGPERSKER
jgi:hypothetical protein